VRSSAAQAGVDFGELLREPPAGPSIHPNIVSSSPPAGEPLFIVMDYVPGQTLETIITREGALDLNRSFDYICQICNAVDHAHQQGVLHRDLRPSNVLVSENGKAKVADFGTSRFLEIAAHGTTVIGSPPYMAPEQFQGKAVFASDVYSLGVTMYQMLTGMLPYDTPTPADLDRLMRGGLVSPPRARNPKVPRALNDVILKAMAPDIHARYQRAGELLEAVLAARGSSPRPTPRPASSETEGAGCPPRLKARETPRRASAGTAGPAARASRCPFCGEGQ
jgi:serine/threonine-protein kinase